MGQDLDRWQDVGMLWVCLVSIVYLCLYDLLGGWKTLDCLPSALLAGF